LAPHALVLAVVLPLIAGAVVGYVVRGALEAPVAVPEEAKDVAPPQQQVTALPDDASAAVANADAETLRARVRELEKLLNEREASIAKLSADAARPQEVPPPPPSGEEREQRARESYRERMERMKQEEPERYAEMQKRQEEFRARMRAANEERDTYLSTVDTSRMTAEQKAGHERLLAALKTRDTLGERMRPDAENPLTDEERQEFFNVTREIGPLMEQERRYLLEETGRTYGEDGATFAEYIPDLMDFTTPWRGPRQRGGGRGPRPDGGPGGPGGPPPGGPR
jgi:hypothetical protein